MKTCTVCNIERELANFYKRSDYTDRYRSRCKLCDAVFRKESYIKNKEKELTKANEYNKAHRKENSIYNRDYYKNNQEEIKNRVNNYRIDNPEMWKKYKKQQLIYQKYKMETDVLYKLKKNMRSSINSLIRKNGYIKNSKTENIIGISFVDFKLYLESKFDSWMDWENHGKYNGELNYGWDIDHIVPLSSAKSEEELLKLNHFTNLQPLCSYTNRYIKKDNINYYPS